MTTVRLRDAAATVDGRTIWSGVDFDVAPGEFVAVLGPNGAGKSTLLKALLGLTPARGTIEVLGAPPGKSNGRIGYVAQRRPFDASLRIRGIDVVGMGFDGARWGTPLPWRTATRRHRVAQVVESVGACGYARRPIGRCSGGEQQRLLLAQALVRRPDLLLLDEPLDSLDVPNQAAISALVRDICRRDGVAVIMVAHDVNPILPYLDRVVYIARGTAVGGTPEQILTADQLTSLYGMPIDVLRDRTGRMFVVGQPDVPPGHGDDPR